ncbi:MAG: Lrp/AsnC family transcriptional regulator [Nitrososphaera sp.]|uniref:Lrp/AsnC family transcriptional regulator n=1 Tax=Nitrososphaera sp. TaxID=1971748 RepID=UPI003D6E6D0B
MPLAFVFINCLPDQLSGVERKVGEVGGVVESYSTNGIYDMLLKVKAENEAALRDIIKKVKRIRGIASTITSIAYKEDSGQ